jgi:HlyD family secretion protein
MTPTPTDRPRTEARRWSARRHVAAGVALSVALFSGLGLWASQAMIAGAVIAPGHLRVDTKRKEVSHLEGGVVEAILVRDGDRVRAGDVLLRLDPTAVAANLEIVDGQLDELMAQRARLRADQVDAPRLEPDAELAARVAARPQAAALLDGQRAIFEANRLGIARQISQLREQIEQTRQQIAGFAAQRDAADLQLALVREELADRRELLEAGYAPKTQVTELRRREAELVGERGAIGFRIAEAAARIAEIEMRVLEIGAERSRAAISELREVGARINELREQRTALVPALRRMEIVAPQAGVVLNLAANTVGGVIEPAAPILSIVPENERLVVEVRIDAIARDRVWLGQEARIRFPGFNQRTTPEVVGPLRRIAADALVDERTGASFFLAEIEIPGPELSRLRRAIDMDLTPGMPAEVLIQTAERSAGSYLMKPLTDNLARAFREE